MLQHNVPLDEAKRTPLACQTCRRRKTKCDSNHPCSACADLGDSCVREPSSMQAIFPRAQDSSHSVEEGKRVEEAAEGDEARETGIILATSSTEATSSRMQLEYTAPITNDENNGLSAVSMELDSLRPLAEATFEMPPEISLPTHTPGTIPSPYFGDAPPLLDFPFELPLPTSTEPEDQLPAVLSTEMQMDSTNFATGWLHQSEALASQISIAQIKSAEFDHFHQAWPLLHVPTFTVGSTSTLLASALSNLSLWMQNPNNRHLVPEVINQELTLALMARAVSISPTGNSGCDPKC